MMMINGRGRGGIGRRSASLPSRPTQTRTWFLFTYNLLPPQRDGLLYTRHRNLPLRPTHDTDLQHAASFAFAITVSRSRSKRACRGRRRTRRGATAHVAAPDNAPRPSSPDICVGQAAHVAAALPVRDRRQGAKVRPESQLVPRAGGREQDPVQLPAPQLPSLAPSSSGKRGAGATRATRATKAASGPRRRRRHRTRGTARRSGYGCSLLFPSSSSG